MYTAGGRKAVVKLVLDVAGYRTLLTIFSSGLRLQSVWEPFWEQSRRGKKYRSRWIVLIETGSIDSEKDTGVFDELTLELLCVSEKLQEWNSDSSCKYVKHRWTLVFQHFRDDNVNHAFFRKSSRMFYACLFQVSVLKATVLLTKVNSKISCPEFD